MNDVSYVFFMFSVNFKVVLILIYINSFQLFTQSGLPLRSVDFSHNSLRRLTERLLQALQATLVELRLADNLLGDSLNPIFSSSEFHGLRYLQILDLSGNKIKAIEEGILEGCDNLQVRFYF